MSTQFVGYDLEADSRIHSFDVMDAPQEARELGGNI
jgi:hypothetical protein